MEYSPLLGSKAPQNLGCFFRYKSHRPNPMDWHLVLQPTGSRRSRAPSNQSDIFLLSFPGGTLYFSATSENAHLRPGASRFGFSLLWSLQSCRFVPLVLFFAKASMGMFHVRFFWNIGA